MKLILKPALSQERLRELMLYDPETGIFTWIKSRRGPKTKDNQAGHMTSDGHIIIWLEGRRWKAHQLAWLYVYGEFAESTLDHIDLNGCNNRINNLRKADDSQNQANTNKRVNNTSGFKGVSFHYGKWRAAIVKDRIKIHLGVFKTKEEAAEAYRIAAVNIHKEYARI